MSQIYMSIFKELVIFFSKVESLTFLLTFLTLLISYFAYQGFLKNDLAKEQLKLVINLIDKLNDSNLSFSLYRNYDNCSSGYYWEGNFFELANIESNIMDKHSIYMSYHYDVEFKFISTLANPLLPKMIAFKLLAIAKWNLNITNTKDLQSFIIIGSLNTVYINNEEHDLDDLFLDQKYPGDFKTFRLNCKDLKMTIIKWLNGYGIKDLNPNVFSKYYHLGITIQK